MENWAKGIIDKIGSLSVRKSKDPAVGETGDSATAIENVAMEAAEKMSSGELDTNVEAVKAFLIENGIEEAEADDYATDIIDAYFGADDIDSDEGDDMGGEDDDMMKSSLPDQVDNLDPKLARQILKSLQNIEESLGVLGFGLTHALDQIEESAKNQTILKSSVETFLDQPVRKTTIQKSNIKNEGVNRDFVSTKNLILKGIIEKKLSTEDMSAWEMGKNLTPAAEQYITEAKS